MDDTHAIGETWEQAEAMVDDVLRRLNADPSRLCEATRGNPLRLTLVLTNLDAEIRIVVMADGIAVRVSDEALLGEDFAPRITLRGTLQELAALAIGRTSLDRATEQTILTSTVSPDLLDAVRETIGRGICEDGQSNAGCSNVNETNL